MELWSIALILAVAAVALELVSVLRRGVAQQRGYFVLLVVDGALLGWSVSEPRFAAEGAGPWPEVVAGVVLCALIVFLPMVLERMIRRALQGDRLATAARLASLRELLQPGRAASAERELYAELAAVKAGRVDEVVRGLRARLAEAEPPMARSYHERIVAALALAGRAQEAVSYYEVHFGGEDPAHHAGLAIQMVRAYGLAGDLRRSAQLVHHLEQAASGRELAAQAALLQARLLFVAVVLGGAGVERAIDGGKPPLERAARRLRALVADVLAARAAATQGAEGDEEVVRYAEAMAERLQAELRAVASAPPQPLPRVTLGLIAANAIGFALFVALLGDFSSGYDLVRGGASFHAAVRAGEWWRLWTAMFLHGGDGVGQGLIHLGLNMYGLWLLGRIVEQLYGRMRFFVLYAVAGLVGNVASVWNPRPEAVLSLGASGAVMGLMGALLVVLLIRRGVWSESSRRALLVNLVVLLVVQLGIGLFVRVVDNFAHAGGLVGGFAAGLVLAPRRGGGGAARYLVAAAAGVLLATALAAATALATSRVDRTLARIPWREERIASAGATIALPVPQHAHRSAPPVPDWPGEEILEDAISAIGFAPHLLPVGEAGVPGALEACRERDRAALEKLARDAGRPAPTLEELSPPSVSGYQASGMREPRRRGEPERRMLYYGRLAGPARPGMALVVEITDEAPPKLRASADGEIARALEAAKVN